MDIVSKFIDSAKAKAFKKNWKQFELSRPLAVALEASPLDKSSVGELETLQAKCAVLSATCRDTGRELAMNQASAIVIAIFQSGITESLSDFVVKCGAPKPEREPQAVASVAVPPAKAAPPAPPAEAAPPAENCCHQFRRG